MVSQEPLVSVVVPTHNRRDAVVQAIGSVLQQTYKALEVIVVDDGSDDGTEEALAAIDDPRVRLLKHPQNAGGATARNTGIDAAEGGLVALIDSDDLWLSDKLARQVPFLLAQRDHSRAVCYTQVYLDTGRKRLVRPIVGKRDDEPVGDYLLLKWDNVIHTSTLLLSRQLAVMTRFEDGLRCHQDWDFCLRLEHRGARFAFLAEPLAIWQNEDRSDRLSRSFDPRYSAHWLERARDSLSDRAYLARSAYLAPLIDDNRWSALAKVLVALRTLVVSPVAYTLNALERPDILLVWNGVRFVAVLGALIGVPALGGTPVQAVTAYSATLAATYAALYVICLWQISVRGPEREAPPLRSPPDVEGDFDR